MKTRGKRVDANQADIVDAMRRFGASVELLSDVGRGVPDLLVGYQGGTYLAELKVDGGTFTPDQLDWRQRWRGAPAPTLRSVGEAITWLTMLARNAHNA